MLANAKKIQKRNEKRKEELRDQNASDADSEDEVKGSTKNMIFTQPKSLKLKNRS